MDENTDAKHQHDVLSLLTDHQLTIVTIQARVMIWRRAWYILAVVAAVGLLVMTGGERFDPAIGLLALLVVTLFLAALAALLRRK